MKTNKQKLLVIATKIKQGKPVTPQEIDALLSFAVEEKDSSVGQMLKQTAFPLALFAGFLFVTFADFFDSFTATLPSWTVMSPELLAGVDYLWDFIGEPIGKENSIYHLPNVILYTFGFFGIKKIIETVEKRTWLETVMLAQEQLRQSLEEGKQILEMKQDHSILFVGKGDFVAEQFVLEHPIDEAVIVSETKPAFTNIWSCYDLCTLYDDLKKTLFRSDAATGGEYLFFPVQDNHLFLPSADSYDLAPHKLDILIQNIRTIEKEQQWVENRIIIVGDRYHHSSVQTVDERKVLKDSEEIISLASIAQKHTQTYLIDPSDLVLKKIIEIAKGRNILFRATKAGINEYKERFYERLHQLSYTAKLKTTLTVGYDILEDLTEQQTLKKSKNYLPVILSHQVKEAIERNGYARDEYIYVPELVLDELKRLT